MSSSEIVPVDHEITNVGEGNVSPQITNTQQHVVYVPTPTYIQQQSPYIHSQSPYVQQQIPYTHPQSSHSQHQSPYIQHQTPYTQPQSSHAQHQSPYIQPQSPQVQQQSPYLQPHTPQVHQQSPYAYSQPPHMPQQTPAYVYTSLPQPYPMGGAQQYYQQSPIPNVNNTNNRFMQQIQSMFKQQNDAFTAALQQTSQEFNIKLDSERANINGQLEQTNKQMVDFKQRMIDHFDEALEAQHEASESFKIDESLTYKPPDSAYEVPRWKKLLAGYTKDVNIHGTCMAITNSDMTIGAFYMGATSHIDKFRKTLSKYTDIKQVLTKNTGISPEKLHMHYADIVSKNTRVDSSKFHVFQMSTAVKTPAQLKETLLYHFGRTESDDINWCDLPLHIKFDEYDKTFDTHRKSMPGSRKHRKTFGIPSKKSTDRQIHEDEDSETSNSEKSTESSDSDDSDNRTSSNYKNEAPQYSQLESKLKLINTITMSLKNKTRYFGRGRDLHEKLHSGEKVRKLEN